MRTIIIPFLVEEEKKVCKDPLMMLGQYVLPNLVSQTRQSYTCFIEYLPKDIDRIKPYKEKYKGYPIIWVPQSGFRYTSGVFKYRKILQLEDIYIQKLNLVSTDSIIFMRWPINAIYSLNLIKYLLSYELPEEAKILRFSDGGYTKTRGSNKVDNDENLGGFVYICSPREYNSYFKIYKKVMGFNYKMFEDFPQKVVNEVQCMLLTEKTTYESIKKFIR